MMNKTDAILLTLRLHEALRRLPRQSEIHGFETFYDSDLQTVRIEIHLSRPVEWPAVFDGKRFMGWMKKRIAVTPFAFAWWAEPIREADDGNDD